VRREHLPAGAVVADGGVEDPARLAREPGVLREPRALIAQTTATLPGLDGRKMSKSYGNAISLMAEPDDMRKQIQRIVTDSTPPAQPKDPDTCTLVALLRAFADPGTVAAVEERYRTGGIGYGEVKARLADAIDAHEFLASSVVEVLAVDAQATRHYAAIVAELRRARPRSPRRWSSGRLSSRSRPRRRRWRRR
jgi:tryptophanyl-tRNA synthetase